MQNKYIASNNNKMTALINNHIVNILFFSYHYTIHFLFFTVDKTSQNTINNTIYYFSFGEKATFSNSFSLPYLYIYLSFETCTVFKKFLENQKPEELATWKKFLKTIFENGFGRPLKIFWVDNFKKIFTPLRKGKFLFDSFFTR